MPSVSTVLLKIRIWAKITVLAVVVIYSLLFMLLNSEDVNLWLFPGTRVKTSLLVAILGSFVLGALLAVLVRMAITTVRQMRVAGERRRAEQLEREIGDMRAKTATLQTREEV